MSESILNGTKREIDGRPSIYFDGYWIKRYDPPQDSLAMKRELIDALVRRLFNHVEHGINMPGNRLNEARFSYESESEPERKRVKGAMLAGALFNRAGDIFRKLVELQALGVEIKSSDSLMRECGQCLIEALSFGETVRHRNGDESIDELWGEPFKAFSIPVEEFYLSRYIKIAMTMRDIDHISEGINQAFLNSQLFEGFQDTVQEFTAAAKMKCETLRTDPEIFEIWPSFVVSSERLSKVRATLPESPTSAMKREVKEGLRLIKEGRLLITNIARARVPMHNSTEKFIERCKQFRV
ncbi:MAG: hypothetical protein V3V12_06915 [Gammaproteobacteria bacterium]